MAKAANYDPRPRFVLWLRQGPHGRALRKTREWFRALSHRAFVMSAFRALLERDPDAEGLDHYVRDLAAGRITREHTMRHIGRSAEASAHVLHGPGLRDHVEEFCRLRRTVPAGVRPICFLHVMKCGGTGFGDALSTLADPWPRLTEVWIDQLVCLPRPLLAQAMLVTGHLPYAVMALLAPDAAACTIIREPVTRTLSHFAHVRVHGRERELTLDEFVFSEEWRPQWENYQARQLVLDLPVDEAWRGSFAGRLQTLLDTGPVGLDETALSDRATKRLDSIELRGVTDDLDGLLRRVAAFWRQPPPAPVGRTNPSVGPVRPEAVPERIMTEIVRSTAVDAALYDRVREATSAAG